MEREEKEPSKGRRERDVREEVASAGRASGDECEDLGYEALLDGCILNSVNNLYE